MPLLCPSYPLCSCDRALKRGKRKSTTLGTRQGLPRRVFFIPKKPRTGQTECQRNMETPTAWERIPHLAPRVDRTLGGRCYRIHSYTTLATTAPNEIPRLAAQEPPTAIRATRADPPLATVVQNFKQLTPPSQWVPLGLAVPIKNTLANARVFSFYLNMGIKQKWLQSKAHRQTPRGAT